MESNMTIEGVKSVNLFAPFTDSEEERLVAAELLPASRAIVSQIGLKAPGFAEKLSMMLAYWGMLIAISTRRKTDDPRYPSAGNAISGALECEEDDYRSRNKIKLLGGHQYQELRDFMEVEITMVIRVIQDAPKIKRRRHPDYE